MTKEELLKKTVEQGTDNLSNEEKMLLTEINNEARKNIKASIEPELRDSIREAIGVDKSEDYYKGLVEGFKTCGKILTNMQRSILLGQPCVLLSEIERARFFIASNRIILEDELIIKQAKQEDKNVK